MVEKSNIGLIGLAVMGKNLARNFAGKGFKTSVYNRSYQKTLDLLANNYDNLIGFESLTDFIESLERPRKIILLVKSGKPVDDFIDLLRPLLDEGDIIADCGNSNWLDTHKRQLELSKSGFDFVGCGISGGEEGALNGPSIMPGGDQKIVEQLLPILQQAAAKDFKGNPCVTNVGRYASGHFVKMVHNGIEYSMMQAITEVYDLLRSLSHSNEEIREYFERLNVGYNKSFLLDITIDILKSKSAEGKFLIDIIDQKAGAKGTGKWTVESAMDLGIAVPNIFAGLNARVLSSKTQNFTIEQKSYSPTTDSASIGFDTLKSALETMFLVSYLQGIDLIIEANKVHNWSVNISEVCRIWQGGCIIRSNWLNLIPSLLANESSLSQSIHEYKDEFLSSFTKIQSLLGNQIPLPVLNATKDYLISVTSNNLPQNLIQAQRDYFGAHTYKIKGKPEIFTGGWN
ncbi:MAG: NADP-dependent phosphogluconate dehydrogenase [Patescibacteria group bacterium]